MIFFSLVPMPGPGGAGGGRYSCTGKPFPFTEQPRSAAGPLKTAAAALPAVRAG
jgi:hypothetical protein